MKSSDAISILATLLLIRLQLAAACELFFNDFLHICQTTLFQFKLSAMFHLIKLSENYISSGVATLQSRQNCLWVFSASTYNIYYTATAHRKKCQYYL